MATPPPGAVATQNAAPNDNCRGTDARRPDLDKFAGPTNPTPRLSQSAPARDCTNWPLSRFAGWVILPAHPPWTRFAGWVNLNVERRRCTYAPSADPTPVRGQSYAWTSPVDIGQLSLRVDSL